MEAGWPAAALLAGLVGLGCFLPVPRADDEALLIRELGLPGGTTCPQLLADPSRPGTFGREGLRIEAVCVPPGGWRPPDSWSDHLPAGADALRRPPGLRLPAGGRAICWVGVWITGQVFEPHPCDAAPETYHRHRSAVFDPALGQIRVVLQDLY